jgi:hypothetical protein
VAIRTFALAMACPSFLIDTDQHEFAGQRHDWAALARGGMTCYATCKRPSRAAAKAADRGPNSKAERPVQLRSTAVRLTGRLARCARRVRRASAREVRMARAPRRTPHSSCGAAAGPRHRCGGSEIILGFSDTPRYLALVATGAPRAERPG